MGNVALYVDNGILLIRDKQHFVSAKKRFVIFVGIKSKNVQFSSCGFKIHNRDDVLLSPVEKQVSVYFIHQETDVTQSLALRA